MGIRLWIIGLGAISLLERLQAQPDYKQYIECDDNWDVEFPYLVEVRYTGEPFIGDQRQRNYHRNRHGALLTTRTVLTRPHDLGDYPNKEEQSYIERHKDIKECMDGGNRFPCLYVNTRRPQNKDDPNTKWCGFNSIVTRAVRHPKFTTTPYQTPDNLKIAWNVNRFAFVVLILKDEIKTPAGQTVFPSVILPRTPLDMFYMQRRIETRGSDSKMCQYPHYNKLTHKGYYGPYASRDLLVARDLNCTKHDRFNRFFKNNRTKCINDAICPSREIVGSWEGVELDYYGAINIRDCEKMLLPPSLYPYSFMVFPGEKFQFATAGSNLRRIDTEDKLGAPVVCNGVLMAIVTSWNGRGRGRADVYIANSLFRAWSWILGAKRLSQNLFWHRAKDDHPFLGQAYRFRKKEFKKRDYKERSIFELSLSEVVDPRARQFSRGSQVGADVTATLLFIVHAISY